MHLSSAAPLITRLFGSTAVLALVLLSSALWAGDENDASGNTNPCTNVTLTITGPAEMPLGQATEFVATVDPAVKGNYTWTISDGGAFDDPTAQCNGTTDTITTNDCPLFSKAKALGTRVGEITITVDWVSCDTKFCKAHATKKVKVIPGSGNANLKVPKMPLGSKNRRVDVHGVPMPDPSPTGEGESDRIPNQAYTDMFTLSPTYAVSDAALKAEGGELLVEFRRTSSIQFRNYHPDITRRGIHFPTADLLGMGWDVNPVSNVRIHIRQDDSGLNYVAAYAQDETGSSYEYQAGANTPAGTYSWIPDVRHSYNASAFKTELNQVDDTHFVLRKSHGTTYYYTYATTFVDPISRYSACATTLIDFEKYYRLDKIVDRNGNTILFDYYGAIGGSSADTDASIIPKKIWEQDHPQRSISIQAQYHPEWFDTGRDGGWRIHSVTDGLGRQTTYQYGSSAGMDGMMVASVKPAVEDPANPAGPKIQPKVKFGYYSLDLPDSVLDPLNPPHGQQGINRWCSLSEITDARNHTTSMTFAAEWFPTEVYAVLNSAIWTQRIRVASMTTVDGTATFSTATRQPTSVVTSVVDTRGTAVSFAFSGVAVAVPTSSGGAIFITKCVRSGGGGTTTFDFSADPCGNLTKVTDMSGNVIAFEYASGQLGDPFDLPIDPTQPLDPILNPRKYAGLDKPAKRIVDPAGLNLSTVYRYDPLYAKLIKTTDAENRVTDEILDARGNRLEIREPLLKTSKYTYYANGEMKSQIDPDGRTTELAIQFPLPANLAAFRTVTQKVTGYGTELNLTTLSVEDLIGNKRSMTDPRGFVTTYQLDDLDRVVAQIDPAIPNPTTGALEPTTTEKHYDLNGNVICVVDAEGNATVYGYDLMNRQVSQRRRMTAPNTDGANDLVTGTGYNAVGLVASTTDANHNVTTMEYDGLLRLTRKTFPAVPGTDGTGSVTYFETYEYGANAGSGAFAYWSGWNPTRVVDKRGNAKDTVYDAIYRPIRSVQRKDTAVAFDAPARPGEPASEMTYTKLHQVVAEKRLNETGAGALANQFTYTYYDDLLRPTVMVQDLGDGPQLPIGTTVNDASSFPNGNLNLVTRTSYDKAGHVLTSIDPLGRITTTEYDGDSRPTKTTLPAVPVVDPVAGGGTPTLVTVYDENGNKIRTKDVRGTQTQTSFDAQNRAFQVIVDLNGDSGFDPTPNGADIVTKMKLNRAGATLQITDSRGFVTTSVLDRAYRVTGAIQPTVRDAVSGTDKQPTTASQLDGNGNVVLFTDADGNQVEKVYDSWNQVSVVTVAKGKPEASTTKTFRDGNGNVVGLLLVNPGTGNQLTTYQYDAFNRKTTETLPVPADGLARKTVNTFDRMGNVLTSTDPKGQVSINTYDTLNRLRQSQRKVSVSGAIAETRTFLLSKTGKLLTVTDASGTSTFVYDAHDRVETETRANTATNDPAYTVTSRYDLAGNRTQVTYPISGRIVLSGFDRASRLRSSTDQATGSVTTYTYDPLGNCLSKTTAGAAGGVVETATFDALSRMSTSLNKTPTRTLFAAVYGYDLVGNRVTAMETQAGQDGGGLQDPANLRVFQRSYRYDSQYRLTRERTFLALAPTRVLQEDFGYDAAGNRITHARTDNLFGATPVVSETLVYDVLNRALSITPSVATRPKTAYTYDLNGNQLTKTTAVGAAVTSAVTFTWDVWNRLIAATDPTQGGAIFAATYDYRTRRLTVQEGTSRTKYRYDGGDCFQETNTNRVVQVEYVRGGGLGGGIGGIIFSDRRSVNGPLEQFSYNPVGNTVAVTDQAGALTQSSLYDSFGNELRKRGNSKNKRLANTKEHSVALNLDNHGFRYYDAEIGRYISRDPIDYADGPNVYLYVHNNPINHIDPLGLAEDTNPPPPPPPKKEDPLRKEATNPESGKLPVLKGFEDPRYQKHDALISGLVKDFNKNKAKYAGATEAQAAAIGDLDPALVKAWFIQESGGSDARSKAAWEKDPAQVNVPGDWTSNKEQVGLKQPSERNEGDLQANVQASLAYLARKGFASSGNPAGKVIPRAGAVAGSAKFDGWQTALERYNGRTETRANDKAYRQNYAERIIERAANPQVNTPIPLPGPKE